MQTKILPLKLLRFLRITLILTKHNWFITRSELYPISYFQSILWTTWDLMIRKECISLKSRKEQWSFVYGSYSPIDKMNRSLDATIFSNTSLMKSFKRLRILRTDVIISWRMTLLLRTSISLILGLKFLSLTRPMEIQRNLESKTTYTTKLVFCGISPN